MAMLNDFRFDLALHYATLYCCKEDIEYIDSLKREDITVSPKTKLRVMRQWDREQREPRFRVPKYLKTAVVAILLSISILFGVAMCIEPVRAAFIDAVVTWYEDYFLVSFQKSQVDTEFVPMEPTYIPDGFELKKSYLSAAFGFFEFADETGNYFTLEQHKEKSKIDVYNDILDWEKTDSIFLDKYGKHITFYFSSNCTVAIWEDNNVFKMEYFGISESEILKIVKSLR